MSSPSRRYPVSVDMPAPPHEPRHLPNVRRETRIVSHRDDDGSVAVHAQGRIVREPPLGASSVVAATARSTFVTLLVDSDRTIVDLDSSDHGIGGLSLRGMTLGGGFRRHLASATGTLDRLTVALLDQLPGAVVVSGYRRLYDSAAHPQPAAASSDRRHKPPKVDICAGWGGDGTMVSMIRRDGGIPAPIGPVVDPATLDDSGWDPRVTELPEGAVRREIRYELSHVNASWVVDAWLRDSHMRPSGQLGAVHEYGLSADVDAQGIVRSALATPHVLPWPECPSAVDSVARLVGRRVGEIRDIVGSEFRGISTCTHLNDLARGIADVPWLVEFYQPDRNGMR